MKCYNLTDIETPELKKRGLVNKTIAVGSVLIRPGESAEVSDNAVVRQAVKSYGDSVIAVDRIPVAYVAAKSHAATQAAVVAQAKPSKPKKPVFVKVEEKTEEKTEEKVEEKTEEKKD